MYLTPALARTIKPHGMTGPEIRRGSDALHLSEDEKRQVLDRAMSDPKSRLWWLTTNKGTSRTAIADIWKRITRLQRKYLVRPYSLRGLESSGGLHAHIPFIGTPDIVRSLTAASFGAVVDIAPVHNADRLIRRYFTKERTPQAGYGREHVLGGRLRGSHRLDGGGDRVRLSRDLERDAISAGAVEDWQRTNARRTDKRKGYRLRGAGPLARAPKLAGQLPLLIELGSQAPRVRGRVCTRRRGFGDQAPLPSPRIIAARDRGADRSISRADRECPARPRSDLAGGREPAPGRVARS
jgi:hypothetical protein